MPQITHVFETATPRLDLSSRAAAELNERLQYHKQPWVDALIETMCTTYFNTDQEE